MEVLRKKMEVVFDAENAEKFVCNICDFKCCKQSNYSKHLLTLKHQKAQNGSIGSIFDAENANKYMCKCSREFKTHSGYWKHKKNCVIENNEEFQLLKNLMVEVVKSNNDLQKQMIELCKNSTTNTINSNINSNNKAFNLQFFLNETCKDAMNISEFVDSLTLQLSDLENVGKLGFVEGMSNIIIENMKLLDISKRPIHCMDTKRDVIYLKDQNTWEKSSDDDNKKIRRVIKQIATKNVRNLRLFKEKHPDCINYNSKYSDQYLKLQTESCGGKHPDYENESKIIKRLAKEMAVDKSL